MYAGTPPVVGPARRYRGPPSILVASAAFSVVAGGLVAAVTGPLMLDRGSWVAAYLVLVCGVGGWGIGAMQGRATAGLSPVWARVQLGAWALGNVVVIIGSLSSIALGVDAGVVLLELALVIAFISAPAAAAVGRMSGWGYRSLLIVLMVSAPIGSALSHV